jgi:hypothetical protein
VKATFNISQKSLEQRAKGTRLDPLRKTVIAKTRAKSKEPGLTLEQHRQLSLKLREIRSLLSLFLSTRRNRVAERFGDHISKIKCEMDEVVFQDFPELEHIEQCRVYYGNPTLEDLT